MFDYLLVSFLVLLFQVAAVALSVACCARAEPAATAAGVAEVAAEAVAFIAYHHHYFNLSRWPAAAILTLRQQHLKLNSRILNAVLP